MHLLEIVWRVQPVINNGLLKIFVTWSQLTTWVISTSLFFTCSLITWIWLLLSCNKNLVYDERNTSSCDQVRNSDVEVNHIHVMMKEPSVWWKKQPCYYLSGHKPSGHKTCGHRTLLLPSYTRFFRKRG